MLLIIQWRKIHDEMVDAFRSRIQCRLLMIGVRTEEVPHYEVIHNRRSL